jgi:NAD(P)-dependent dehydrogenase (short-subunit alcohol dehydrogenase family)
MKWAVVTGSSSGLGLAMTVHLLEQGYAVAGGSRSGTEIEHEHFYDLELDVSDEASVEEFYETLADLTKKVDVFVQNAGICEMATISESDSEFFARHLATNTLGAFHMLRGLEPFLIKGQTHVISILSSAAKFAYPNMTAYNASKFGLKGLLESLQKEWKDYNLRFTPLYSGAVNTPLWDDLPREFARARMLSQEEFLYVFDFVLNAPENLRMVDLTFLHREGFLE